AVRGGTKRRSPTPRASTARASHARVRRFFLVPSPRLDTSRVLPFHRSYPRSRAGRRAALLATMRLGSEAGEEERGDRQQQGGAGQGQIRPGQIRRST